MRKLPEATIVFDLEGQPGALEAVFEPAAGPTAAGKAPPGVAIVLHPHPLYGGDMHNAVVQAVSHHWRERGIGTLRFNFRGTGRSAGTHDQGRGEIDDLDAAIRWVSPSGSDTALWLAGYSFGAAVLMKWLTRNARETGANRPEAALLLAPPIEHYDFTGLAANNVPLALVCATADGLTPRAVLEEKALGWGGSPKTFWIEGAGHDLAAGTATFNHTVTRALRALAGEP